MVLLGLCAHVCNRWLIKLGHLSLNCDKAQLSHDKSERNKLFVFDTWPLGLEKCASWKSLGLTQFGTDTDSQPNAMLLHLKLGCVPIVDRFFCQLVSSFNLSR